MTSGRAFPVLTELALAAAGGQPLDALFGVLVERVRALLKADGVVAALPSRKLRVASGLDRVETERLAARAPATERIEDATRDGRFRGMDIGSLVASPLLSSDEPVGLVIAIARRRRAFSPEHEEQLALLTRHFIADTEAARLYRQATTDAESGAGSRQLLAARLPEEIARSRRDGGKPLALVRIAVREMARVKAVHGRVGAGAVMAEVVARTRACLRPIDHVVRLGEDALLCLMPGGGAAGAKTAARRIEERVSGAAIVAAAGIEVQARVACAVVVLEEGMKEMELLEAAERAVLRLN